MNSAGQGQSIRPIKIKQKDRELFNAFKLGFTFALDIPQNEEQLKKWFLENKDYFKTEAVKDLRYKNIRQLNKAVYNYRHPVKLSSSEALVFKCLEKLSDNYKWDLYVALHKFIEGFLF